MSEGEPTPLDSIPNRPGHRESCGVEIKRQKRSHPALDLTDNIVAPTSSLPINKSVADHDAPESGTRNDTPPTTQPRDSLVAEKLNTAILFDQSTTVSDDESDNGSLFQFVGDQGDGRTSALCYYCQWMVDNWYRVIEDRHFTFPHYEDTFQLENSVISGCALCYQFWRSSTVDVQRAREEMEDLGDSGYEAPGVVVRQWSHCSLRDVPENSGLSLRLMFMRRCVYDSDNISDDASNDLSDDDWAYETISFSVSLIPSLSSALIHKPDDTAPGNTKDSLPLAARWMERCRKSHWKCRNSIEQYIPTRLISTKEDGIRVCLRTEIAEFTDYATLSHCWGEMKFLTLSRSNIEAFQAQIPQEALSQTFIDAIRVSRDLGFSYLWIDSLCILQDDPDDWGRESALMSAVYGGSSLNIAASGAVDGSAGCFFSRPRTWRCQIELGAGSQAKRYDVVCQALPDRCLSTMPLIRRGWALQERLLAPRTLQFTKTEVFWECHQKSACESFPEELPIACTSLPTYFAKQPLTQSMWTWIVERYSTCKLTYAKDKLVAISGLARHIQKQTKDQYVAGMWRKNLEFHLCWSGPYFSRRSETNLYGAPTWSWASMDCKISFLKRFNETENNLSFWIKILDIKVELSGLDPFGPLSAAKLRLSCSYLLHVNLQNGETEDYMVLNHESIECSLSYDFSAYQDARDLQKAYALPVLGSSSRGAIAGLLLEPTEQKRGQYRRIGQFLFWSEENSESFELALATYAYQVLNEDCFQIRNDKFGKTHYIIEII